ncbi:storkhead-box protein 1 isoform X1 [Trichechus manatus latirostris]|uniref:Storkhead-box protein 1 isoform X1 n=1 Tax=Trichechus manatus latirostris TaxID=127582 RepID=A0A2Y9E3E3_TRIMA|nr:storkhead-box protein 1 isoform X1 [Trichechus manatus latirostris]
MARPVQLAPSSLALVLSRQGLQERATEAGDTEEPSGRAVFRAFCRANARCFWNARLARAASRLAFQGWLRRGVLLVHAPPASLQVLRDAWRRRALRPPRGFRIRAVGDVFPVQMNLIAQSQFIPLAEVLCCAVSDMNAAQIVVTQESLLEHLVKHYPGIAVPSQDILYTTLGTLIKERKIYHTGEGYFIVTPQTYFITNITNQENKKALSDESHPMPTSITYLVSMGSSAELAKENAASISHCQSCRCFPDVCTQDVQEPQIAADVIRKGQKGLRESKPLVQNQAVSVSEENHVCDRAKPLPCTKDREKGKKFGFSLFWRNISRKEKPKTEHSSFSAQFPPEEWPVRDEDNLDNIPRDIEHEIIKRINPILTVDNLIKHTVLMQKYEEQKKYNSQGTSTDMQIGRHKYSSKEGVKKRQSQSAKPRRQGHSHRHKGRIQASEPQQRNIKQETHPKLLATQPTPRSKSPHEVVQKPLGENPAGLGSHVIYKRRISNPFQGLPHRRSPMTKGHKSQKTSDLKPSQSGPKERTFQRSGSLDASRIFNHETKQPYTEQRKDKLKGESIYRSNSVKPIRNHLPDSPQGSVLKIDSKCCSFREGMSGYDVYGGEKEVIPEGLGKSHLDKLGETKEVQHTLPSQDPSSLDQASSACGLVAKTIQQFQNLGLLDYPVGVNHLRQPERQNRDSEEELTRKAFIQDTETANLEIEEPSDNDQALYENEVEDDDGACSSLYLDDDDFSENDDLRQILPAHTQYSFPGGSKWNHLGKQKVADRALTEYNSRIHRLEPPVLNGNECYKPSELLTNPSESQKPNLATESCGLNSGTKFAFNYEEEPSVVECVQASALADGSIFDYYSTRKASSEAETLQDSVGDIGNKPATWSQNPQNQEMKKHFKQKLELFSSSHMPVLSQAIQQEHSHLEGTENHSMAGDSGIDSPRTQSLASNNSVILDGLKRRPNFLQNLEGTKSSQAITPNSLLQLTPVINV